MHWSAAISQSIVALQGDHGSLAATVHSINDQSEKHALLFPQLAQRIGEAEGAFFQLKDTTDKNLDALRAQQKAEWDSMTNHLKEVEATWRRDHDLITEAMARLQVAENRPTVVLQAPSGDHQLMASPLDEFNRVLINMRQEHHVWQKTTTAR